MGAVDIRKGTSSQSHLLPVLLPFPPRRWVIHIWLLGCSLALPFSSPRKGQSRDQDRAGAGWGGGNARLRQFSSQLSFPPAHPLPHPQVFDNTPAALDGTVAAGDEITGVNGRSIKGKTKVEVAKMIQEVKVRLRRQWGRWPFSDLQPARGLSGPAGGLALTQLPPLRLGVYHIPAPSVSPRSIWEMLITSRTCAGPW